MSSGACRALVAIQLALIATILTALPMAAASERLDQRAVTRYTVDPDAGTITVSINARLRNRDNERAFSVGTWGPLIIEDGVRLPRVSGGFQVDGSPTDLAGEWQAIDLVTPVIEPGDEQTFALTYTINGGQNQSESRLAATPARVGKGYIYFCAVGQDLDFGPIRVEIQGKDSFTLTQTGTRMDATDNGLKSTPASSTSPAQQFTCIEGASEENLVETTFLGPDDREILLQAWPERDSWLDAAESNAEPTLDRIRDFLGQPIPGQGAVVVRQTPPASIGGYASAHDPPGVVQLDESAGNVGAEH
jgi:hypothetical protein